MAVFYSPAGNIEVWDVKPDGYLTPDEWLAAHPAVIEDAAVDGEARKYDVLMALNELDAKSVRPARSVALAVANGNPPSAVDVARLADIEAEAQKLRKELAAL